MRAVVLESETRALLLAWLLTPSVNLLESFPSMVLFSLLGNIEGHFFHLLLQKIEVTERKKEIHIRYF